MERITVSLDGDLLEDFDRYLSRNGYTNRSEALRDILRDLLATEQVSANDEGHCVGCLIYVYNHKERTLSSRIVETQHHHHNIPMATLHLHLDQTNCLEATVLEGTVNEVRDLATQITTQTGVRHGRLHIIPID